MKLTEEEVKHVARLANLCLTEDKIEKFSSQLNDILNFVKKLDEANTGNVFPLSNVTGRKNIFREDEIKPSLSQEQALSNAPRKNKGYFKVKAIFEE